MSSRTVVMLIAGFIVVFTLVSLRNYFSEEPVVAAAPAPGHRVLIAKHDMALGAFVQPQTDLDWHDLTDDEANNNVLKDSYLFEGAVNPDDFSGAVVRRGLHAGEIISQNALMKSGEGGFMSAVLQPGKRAVSISVTATSGNAGFISPGDHVDLMVTHRMKAPSTGKETGGDEQVISETFARNVRVLAVDQQLDNPDNKAILAKTVTVEVTPRQAEEVSVAAELGKISMSLVSTTLADKTPDKDSKDAAANDNSPAAKIADIYTDESPPADGAPQPRYTRDGDVSSQLGKKESGLSHVRVIRGDQVETLDFYQDK